MTVSLIYQDFLDAWNEASTGEALLHRYLRPNMPFLQAYHTNFVTGDPPDPEEVIRDYRRELEGRRDRVTALVERLEAGDGIPGPPSSAGSGLRSPVAIRSIPPHLIEPSNSQCYS